MNSSVLQYVVPWNTNSDTGGLNGLMVAKQVNLMMT